MAVVSSLAKGILQSPNCSSRNGEQVSKITIHHMAGFMSAKQCCELFLKESRQASSNYCIDDNEIWCSCSEDLRAWTSGSGENDRKAITFEVKNSTGAPDWKISDAAYNNMIALCVDICRRYNIPKLYFTGDKNGTLTYHYMFQATACPGPYIKSLTQKICDDVNAQLGVAPTPSPEPTTPTTPTTPKQVTYTVVKGDTLSSIARRHGTTWPHLYEINHDIIGKDPNKIYPGQVLYIIR